LNNGDNTLQLLSAQLTRTVYRKFVSHCFPRMIFIHATAASFHPTHVILQSVRVIVPLVKVDIGLLAGKVAESAAANEVC
jgi:hypothetical protein